jgi:hypothetical protein
MTNISNVQPSDVSSLAQTTDAQAINLINHIFTDLFDKAQDKENLVRDALLEFERRKNLLVDANAIIFSLNDILTGMPATGTGSTISASDPSVRSIIAYYNQHIVTNSNDLIDPSATLTREKLNSIKTDLSNHINSLVSADQSEVIRLNEDVAQSNLAWKIIGEIYSTIKQALQAQSRNIG